MRREKRLTRRERSRAVYEAALAQGMEDALAVGGPVYVDYETRGLSSKMRNAQSIPRVADLEYTRKLLAEFKTNFNDIYPYFVTYDEIDAPALEDNTAPVLVVDSVRNIDYASSELRALAYMRERAVTGLGVLDVASSLERMGHEPPQEEALCTEIPALVLEAGQVGGGYGASARRPAASAGEDVKLRRARWYGSFPRALAPEQLRASADPGGTSSEVRQVCAKVSKALAPALSQYIGAPIERTAEEP